MRALPLILALVALGCSERKIIGATGDGAAADGPRDPGPATIKVAAIQYDQHDHIQVTGCTATTDGTCGVMSYIKQAAENGAKLVVTPSYSAYLPDDMTSVPMMPKAEPNPGVGEMPIDDPRWKEGSIIHTMTKAAIDYAITLVFTIVTEEGSVPNQIYRSSVLAVDEQGKVIARHHAFHYHISDECVANEKQLTVGNSVATSVYTASYGKVGLLTTADVQCLVTTEYKTACTEHATDMLKKFGDLKPTIILYPTAWTWREQWGEDPDDRGAPDTVLWQLPNVAVKVATAGHWWLVAANQRRDFGTMMAGATGGGSGIWKPDGTLAAFVQGAAPTVVYSVIPND